MLVLLSSASDPAAESLLSRWSSHGAVRLDPSDLSLPGWRLEIGGHQAGPSRAVVAGEVVPTDRIAGVVTRRPAVYAGELDWVDPADRGYVAAEMTAFLAAFLAALPCPVLNRPTPTCLSGPAQTPEQWTRLAAGLGIPVRPLRIRAPAPADRERGGAGANRGDACAPDLHASAAADRGDPAPADRGDAVAADRANETMVDQADGSAADRDRRGASSCGDAAVPHLDRASVSDRSEGTASIGRPSVTPHGAARLTTVTVVGRRCLGSDDPAAAAAALRLAEAAAAELLAVQFEGAGPTLRFCAASPWPDVAAPAVADALLARLTAADGRGGA